MTSIASVVKPEDRLATTAHALSAHVMLDVNVGSVVGPHDQLTGAPDIYAGDRDLARGGRGGWVRPR